MERRMQGPRGRLSRGARMLPAWRLIATAGIACAIIAPAAQAADTADGRNYELVSGEDPNLIDVVRSAGTTDDGDKALYLTLAGSDKSASVPVVGTYLATRGANGWSERDASLPLDHPSGVGNIQIARPMAVSDAFDRIMVNAWAPFDPDDQDINMDDLYAFDVASKAVEWVTRPQTLPDTVFPASLDSIGTSGDLRRVAIYARNAVLLDGAPQYQIYLHDSAGTRLASLYPDGTPLFAATPAAMPWQRGLGDALFTSGVEVAHGGSHAVSDDARRVFFYEGFSGPAPLYLRDDAGDRTVALSVSRHTGDVGTMYGAQFLAATPDGSVSYFDASAQLTDDAPAGGGIYRYDLDTDTLSFVVGDAAGLQVINSIASEDVSRLYFISTTALTPEAVAGQENAYLWEDGQTKLVATLPSSGRLVRVSRDGRWLLVQSASSIDGAPNNGHVALYRYDADNGSTVCVSCRPDGTDSQGDVNVNAGVQGLMPPEDTRTRGIADDGAVFFATTDRLVPRDVTPAADVYTWRDGKTTLLTSGRIDHDAYLADNTDDGKSVFFMTRDALVPEDRDNDLLDLYVARVGGGFPHDVSVLSRPCTDDDCQGDASARPDLSRPGSVTASGPGNVQPAPIPKTVKRSFRLSRLSAAQRARLVKTGTAQLTVRVTGGGRLSARLRGVVGRRLVTLGGGTRTVRGTATTTVHMTVKLSRAGRRALAAKRRMKLTVEVRLAGVSKAQRDSVTLSAGRR